MQQGTILIPANSISATATISAVDLSKAIVIYNGYTASSDDGGALQSSLILEDSTTLKAIRNSGYYSYTSTISYLVFEL